MYYSGTSPAKELEEKLNKLNLIREYVNPVLQGEITQKVGWNVSNIETVWYR